MGLTPPADRTLIGLVIILLALVARGTTTDMALDPDRVRSSIVESLGLRRIPDPAKANVSQGEYERAHKEYLARLPRSTGDERRDLFTIPAHEIEATSDGTALSFSTSPAEDSDSSTVESANLRLLLDHDESEDDAELEVRVYEYQEHFARRSSRSRIGRLVGQRVVQDANALKRRWLEFDLTDELQDAASLNVLRLLVQVVQKDYLKEDVRPVGGVSIISPTLNVHTIHTNGTSSVRYRRSVPHNGIMSLHRGHRTECRGEGKRCCRHHMQVAFKELEGFEFIIQPKHFDAGYCKGRCPLRFNPAHHHALLQSLMWKEDRKKVPRPCCAPNKLAELEILYFDEEDPSKLKISNWKDMRVLECACS